MKIKLPKFIVPLVATGMLASACNRGVDVPYVLKDKEDPTYWTNLVKNSTCEGKDYITRELESRIATGDLVPVSAEGESSVIRNIKIAIVNKQNKLDTTAILFYQSIGVGTDWLDATNKVMLHKNNEAIDLFVANSKTDSTGTTYQYQTFSNRH